jgi:hypothetical protein
VGTRSWRRAEGLEQRSLPCGERRQWLLLRQEWAMTSAWSSRRLVWKAQEWLCNKGRRIGGLTMYLYQVTGLLVPQGSRTASPATGSSDLWAQCCNMQVQVVFMHVGGQPCAAICQAKVGVWAGQVAGHPSCCPLQRLGVGAWVH